MSILFDYFDTLLPHVDGIDMKKGAVQQYEPNRAPYSAHTPTGSNHEGYHKISKRWSLREYTEKHQFFSVDAAIWLLLLLLIQIAAAIYNIDRNENWGRTIHKISKRCHCENTLKNISFSVLTRQSGYYFFFSFKLPRPIYNETETGNDMMHRPTYGTR